MGDIYTNPPQSRNEAIIRATIDGTEYTDPPQSRIEDLLLELKEAIEEGGGGGGTTVVPNPEGEATGDLNKVQIGSTIFGVLGELGTAAKKDSTNAVTQDSSDLVESGAVYSSLDTKQPKTLATPIEIGGVSRTTVEAALGALEDNKEDTILAATPLVKEYDEVMRQEVLRLTMDDTPTASSNNPVKSGGVKSAVSATVDLMKDTTGWIGGNELPNNLVSGSANHVNYSVKDNKSVEIYTDAGGSTAQTTMILVSNADNYKPKAGQKILSVSEVATAIQLVVAGYNGATWVKNLVNTATHTTFTIDYDGYDRVGVYLLVNANNEIDHKIAYPMITTPEQYALNPSYRPYHESVEEMLIDNCKIHRYSFSNDTNPKKFSLGNTPLLIIGKHNGGANISVFFVVSDTDTIATIADVGNKFTLTKDANNVYTITSSEAYWSLVFIGDTIPTVTNAS